MTKLFLHIGLPKTGTSSIQKNLVANRRFLLQQKVKLITSGLQKGRYVETARALTVYTEEEVSAFKATLAQRINQDSGKVLVISEETLGNALLHRASRASKLKSLFGDLEICIVYYERELSSYLISLYLQFTKTGKNIASFEDFIDKMYEKLSPDELYVNLVDNFGKDNVIRRTFSKDTLKNGDAVDDFMDILGVDYHKQPDANVTPPRYFVEFIKAMKVNYFQELSHERFRNRIFKRYAKLAEHASENNELDKEYLKYLEQNIFTELSVAEFKGKIISLYDDCKAKYEHVDKITLAEKEFLGRVINNS